MWKFPWPLSLGASQVHLLLTSSHWLHCQAAQCPSSFLQEGCILWVSWSLRFEADSSFCISPLMGPKKSVNLNFQCVYLFIFIKLEQWLSNYSLKRSQRSSYTFVIFYFFFWFLSEFLSLFCFVFWSLLADTFRIVISIWQINPFIMRHWSCLSSNFPSFEVTLIDSFQLYS